MSNCSKPACPHLKCFFSGLDDWREDGLGLSRLSKHDRDLLEQAVDDRLRLRERAHETVDERHEHVVHVAHSHLLRLRQGSLDVVEVDLVVVRHETDAHAVLKKVEEFLVKNDFKWTLLIKRKLGRYRSLTFNTRFTLESKKPNN